MGNKGIKYVEKYNLDNKDKEIIRVLFENGRYSIANIAKKTGFRRDSIMYRLKKLQENNVITGFQPIINGPAIGFPNVTTLLLKTKITSKEQNNKFIQELIKISQIVHIVTTIGRYDFQLAILYKDMDYLYKIIENIKVIIPEFIVEYEVLQIVEEPKFEDVESLVLNET